jgi:hypothetical protein
MSYELIGRGVAAEDNNDDEEEDGFASVLRMLTMILWCFYKCLRIRLGQKTLIDE